MMENDKSSFDTIVLGGMAYPIVKRKKGNNRIDECPFCGERHSHGENTGHRSAPCKNSSNYLKTITIKGIVVEQTRGYFINEY